jgi:CDP-glucose 4,6-dehydratase
VDVSFGGVFAGRRVLVTGHTGFKGGWLALWLAELGAEVHGFALAPPTAPSLFLDARVAEACASHTLGDVRDFEALRQTVERVRPEIVFHLAAQALVRESYRVPRETFDVNLMGTVNALEAVRRVGGVRVVQLITTDKCYENHEWAYAYRETDPLGGRDPYSASKACAELAAAAYRGSFPGVSVSTTRAGNVIGGGDWAADRIVPDCVAALGRGEAVQVRNPDAVRPWQHVLEPLSGYLLLAAHQWSDAERWQEAWNFGPAPQAAVPVGELVERVQRAWGAPPSVRPHPAPHGEPHEARWLRLDATKAQTRLRWAPVLSLDEAIGQTVAWYRERSEAGPGFDGRAACVRQIDGYTRAAAERGASWAAR